MIPSLLVIASILLAASGALKLRAAARARLGVHLPSLLEVLAGLGIMVLLAGGGVTAAVGFRLVLGAVTLVLVSSVSLAVKLSAHRHERERSEGARLVAYVRYLSESTPNDGPPSLP